MGVRHSGVQWSVRKDVTSPSNCSASLTKGSICTVHCAMCIVNCALSTVHCALCSPQCTYTVYILLCTDHCALCFSHQYTICTVHFAVCTVQSVICNLQWAKLHCELCTVHCKCTQPIYPVNSVAWHCKAIVSDGGSALGGDRSTLESASLSHTLNQIQNVTEQQQ